MNRILTMFIFIIVFATGAAFSAINTMPVDIHYYLGSISAPLSVIMILSLVSGIFLGAIIIYTSNLRLRYENHRLQKKIELLQQETNSLRILPITDSH